MKYKIKEYRFDDGRVWYKAFYKWLIFWHPITYMWAHMSWTAWCQTKEDAQNLIDRNISDHTRVHYKVSNIEYYS
jgi:hypothetical protein